MSIKMAAIILFKVIFLLKLVFSGLSCAADMFWGHRPQSFVRASLFSALKLFKETSAKLQ